jgi:hypothetical protein
MGQLASASQWLLFLGHSYSGSKDLKTEALVAPGQVTDS